MLIDLMVNGRSYSVEVKPHWTLLYVLREKLGLKGAKLGCGTGECGACTVIMGGKAIISCLTLAVQAKGQSIATIEGLADGGLHPLQESFLKQGATAACGFCVPGMIMSAKALLDENSEPTVEEVRRALSGNLCRCTGYVKPVKAVLDAVKILKGRVDDIEQSNVGCRKAGAQS
jgi:aerobic-type carbon monoxide dehydrogenase small subunit (CoxS/CutS family)